MQYSMDDMFTDLTENLIFAENNLFSALRFLESMVKNSEGSAVEDDLIILVNKAAKVADQVQALRNSEWFESVEEQIYRER